MADEVRWDATKFEANLRKLMGRYPTATEQSAAAVAEQVLRHCMFEVPTVPLRYGPLRESATFVVVPRRHWREVVLWVGFNREYAAKVHEMVGPVNWTEPGSGAKYLSSKLQRHREAYVRGWAHDVARRLGMA